MKFGAGTFSDQYQFERAQFFSNENFEWKLGLPQWGIPEWKGQLYSPNCSSKNFLSEYAKKLGCVEVSSTFYSDVSKERLLEWKSMVPENFSFLPKWPQELTHEKLLSNFQVGMSDFIDRVSVLEENLGTTLLQLPPQFDIRYKRELFHFLEALPEGFPVTLELRNPTWFEDQKLYQKLSDYLAKKSISTSCSDTPGARDVFHLSFTGPETIVRFLSDQNDENDRKRILEWKQWIDQQKTGGKLYFIIHRPDNSVAPSLIEHWDPILFDSISDKTANSQTSLL